MATQTAKKRTGVVDLDYGGLTAVCREQGKLVDDVFDEAELARHTRERIEDGLGIRRSTLGALLKVVGPQNLGRILRHGTNPSTQAQDGSGQSHSDPLVEWTEPQFLTPWITLPNDLQYQVSKRRHRHLTETFARVKCYELSFLSDDERKRRSEQLLRHPSVCRKLTPNPRIPINQGSFPDSSWDHWWVIDYWIDGTLLSDVLASERLPLPEIVRIGRQMAEGLKLLHDNAIVRRGLDPKHVLLRTSDRSVVLTDFELAKLLDGAPTVAKGWPPDLYRAPELGDGEVDKSVDIYSWGRIMTYMALGVLPAVGHEKKALHGSNLPESLIDLLARCVAGSPRSRPGSMQNVLDALNAMK
jgi:hypothetical protein